MLRRAVLPLALLACVACAPAERGGAEAPQPVVVEPVAEREVLPVVAASPPRSSAFVGPRQAPGLEEQSLTISLEEGTNIPLAPTAQVAFNTQAIEAALARLRVNDCAVAGDPVGPGHVTMHFNQKGHVTKATLDSGAYRGTSTGDCILKMHEGVLVPPFLGPPAIVGTSVWIK